MASVMSNYWANATIATFLVDGNAFLALHSSDPTSLGNVGTEVMLASYQRQPIEFAISSGKTTANTTSAVFGSISNTVITHLGVWDAQVAGHLLFTIELGVSMTVTDVTSIVIGVSDIAVTL